MIELTISDMRGVPTIAVLAVLLLAPAGRVHAEWTIDADASSVWEANLTRAARRADRESGVGFTPTLTLGYYSQLADALRLETAAELKGTWYPEFDGLSHVAPTAIAGLRWKFGLGALAPWVRGFGTAGVLDYGDDVRDAVVLDGGVQVGKRLTGTIAVQGGYTFESVDAGNGVFNADSHTLAVRGTVEMTPALELALGYGVRWGDLVIHRAVVPGAPRTPHARRVDTFDTPLVAARIEGTTHLVSAALSYAITSAVAVSAGYEYHHSSGPVFEYPNHLVRAAFTVGF